MISFRHISGTNMASVLINGKPIDYEFATAVTHILNTGEVVAISRAELQGLVEPGRLSLIEKTDAGWREFTGRYICKAGPLAVYVGNLLAIIPEEPITYAELQRLGNFETFLTPAMSSRTYGGDED